jgi:hypothetical protein
MIAERTQVALRTAATLVHTAPLLRTVLSANGTPVAVATHPDPEREVDNGVQFFTPCEFRNLVVAAVDEPGMWAEAVPGAYDLSDLSVDVGVSCRGAVHANCMYRVSASPNDHLWLMATTLPASEAHEMGLDIVEKSGWALEKVSAFGIRDDCATGVSTVYARTSEEPGSAGEKRLLEMLETLLARWSVGELLAAEAGDRDSSRRHR